MIIEYIKIHIKIHIKIKIWINDQKNSIIISLLISKNLSKLSELRLKRIPRALCNPMWISLLNFVFYLEFY